MIQKFNPRKTRGLKGINAILGFMFHEKKAEAPLDFHGSRNLLIVDPTAIGDLVMLTPFLRILRKNAPHARISLVCASWGQPVLGEQGLVDEFIYVDSKILNSPKEMVLKWSQIRSTIEEVNRKEYDIALEPRGDLRYIFFMHFCNAVRKVSYNYTGGECFLTDVVRPGDDVKHLVEDKLYLLKQIGCEFEEADWYPRLSLTDEGRKQNEVFLRENGLVGKTIIGIHPGASQANRRWEGFGELLKKLHAEYEDAAFLLFEGPEEQEAVERVREAAEECGANYIVSRTAIAEYMHRMAACDAVICNDSGAGHIAAAYGLPVFVIFGPAPVEKVRPYARDAGKLFAFSFDELPCKPCLSNACSQNNECLRNVLPEMVFETMRENWQSICRRSDAAGAEEVRPERA